MLDALRRRERWHKWDKLLTVGRMAITEVGCRRTELLKVGRMAITEGVGCRRTKLLTVRRMAITEEWVAVGPSC